MISRLEKKILEYIEKHVFYIAMTLLIVIGVLMRIMLRHLISSDAYLFLIPWYNAIKANGGIRALSQQIGDYGIPYQTIIALLTYTPLGIMSSIKLVSCIFDIILAFGCYLIAKKLSLKRPSVVFALVFLSPIVVFNSSAWGQCDSIFVAFCIFAIYFAIIDRPIPMLVMLGLACAFKLQTLFLFPFFLLYYVYKKRFSILWFAIIPIMMIICSLGGIVQGRSILDVFGIYGGQAEHNIQFMIKNYPSIWGLFSPEQSTVNTYFIGAAVLLALACCGAFLWWVMEKKIELTPANMIYIAFLSSYICVLLLPCMHERYGYIYEVLALIIVFINKKTIFPCIGLQLISLRTYSVILTYNSIAYPLLSAFNIALFLWYLYSFIKINNLNKENEPIH